jgi:hypothetical protein
VSGNALLMAKIRVGVRSLAFHLNRESVFSFSILSLPHLQSLNVSMEARHAFYPIPMYTPPEIKHTASKSLKSLTIRSVMASTIYFNDSVSPSLCSVFRDLEYLSLHNCLPNIDIANLQSLPPRLKFLKIHRAPHVQGSSNLSIKDFELAQLLPRTLERLSMKWLEVYPTVDGATLRSLWPPNLRVLSLSRFVGPTILEGLPDLAEEIDIFVCGHSKPDLSVSLLPQTLRKVHLRQSWSIALTLQLDVPLPPQIEYWVGDLDVRDASKLGDYLPKSLKHFQSSTTFHRLSEEKEVFHVLPNLENLTTSPTYSVERLLNVLPRKLTSLSLTTKKMPSVQLGVLPETLTFLHSKFEPAFDLQLLPRGLKELSVPLGSGDVEIEDWDGLPPTLSTLKIAMTRSPSQLAKLPKTLTKLDLSFHAHIHTPVASSASLLNIGQLMPANLEHLSFWLGTPHALPWREWLSNLSHLTRLHTLITSEHYYHKAVDSYEYFKALPRSISALSIPIGPEFSRIHQNSIFSSLPPQLARLHLYAPAGLDTPIDFDLTPWQYLPHSLVELSIPGMRNFHPRFFQVIPKQIEDISFMLASSVLPDHLRYYEAPIWLGHARTNPKLNSLVTKVDI